MKGLVQRAVLAFSVAVTAACSDASVDGTTAPLPQPNNGNQPIVERILTNRAYGTDAAQRIDVYLPANRNSETPVLHGGGFVAGSRTDFNSQSRALMAKGMIVVNVDYRLVDTTGLLTLPPVHRPSRRTQTVSPSWRAVRGGSPSTGRHARRSIFAQSSMW